MNSSNFTPPARRSMTDLQIQDALGNAQADEAGITAAMELLENQAQLRDIEKMEFSAWVLNMERIGSPEAAFAVENAKRAQQGLAPLEPSTVQPVPVEPTVDVAARLNELYTNSLNAQISANEAPVPQSPSSEGTYQDAIEAPEIEPFSFELGEKAEAPVEEVFVESQPQPNSDFSPMDDFDRLLAADAVVGAEDELTAMEEKFESRAATSSSSFANSAAHKGVAFEEELEEDTALEETTLESTPQSTRQRSAFSQFWAWLGLSGSVLPLGLAWYVFQLGISFTQGVIAIFLGAAASAIIIAVGALAGKRSGLPTLMLSRAPFGVFGNIAPAAFLSAVRIAWSAVVVTGVILLAVEFFKVESLGAIIENTESSMSNGLALFATVFTVVALATALAIFGGRVVFRTQQVVGLLGVAAAVTLIAVTAGSISADNLFAQASSNWPETFGVAVFTFAVFGLAWTSSGADFARKIRTESRGAAVVGWGILSLAIIPTAVASYGLALLGSLPKLANRKTGTLPIVSQTVLEDFSTALVPWLGILLISSATLSLTLILSMSMYSSNLSLHSIGAKLHPGLAQPILGLIALTCAVLAVLYLTDVWKLILNYVLIIAIPVAAWSGIFVTDILIRRIAYHEISLSRGYGFYKSVNVVNLVGWLAATAIGFGLTYSTAPGFGWTGYLGDLMANQEFWSTTNFGVIIAFASGTFLPLAFGIPRIKRQEKEVLAIEARRNDLKDVFGLVD